MGDDAGRSLVTENPDVRFRPFELSDLDVLLRSFADAQIRRWNPGPQPVDGQTRAGAVTTWMTARNDWEAGDHRSWAVVDSDDLVIGSLSLHKLDLDQRDSEVGYWVAPWARGCGRGGLMLRTATRWGFETLGLHRVHLFHAVENVGSCRVAEAAGFLLEGTLREGYRYADGAYHDEHLHACLASDA